MTVYEYGDISSTTVLIQPVDDMDLSVIENEVGEIKRLSDKPFRLIAYKVENWNKDLSPWSAPPVFGREPFGEGAESTLKEILKLCTDSDKTYVIGGYSLAGLFALWAGYQSNVFAGIVAASPSMWFPKFTDYMKNNDLLSGNIYLSLGDKEEKARNPIMATVGDRMRETYSLLKEQGVNCIMEWNEGNHFKDSDIRTARGFAWVLNEIKN